MPPILNLPEARLLTYALSVFCATHTAFATVGANTPFTSFEAENGTLAGGAQIQSLTGVPTTQYSSPQLEASGHAYVQLTATGQSVTWTNTTGQIITALNLRSCIPDAPAGGGTTSTLDLYVNGSFRQAFSVNSLQNYCYEGTNYNGQEDKDPADGHPRGFWNDTHAFITGAPVAPGDTLAFQKDAANAAAFYDIDVVDLEAPPSPLAQPANSLSILSFGAVSNNVSVDNTAAINSCFNAAQAQGKLAWIPPGIYCISAIHGGLNAAGIAIAGAGPWYSTIYRVTPANNTQGVANIITTVSCTLQDVALDCNSSSRAGNNNNGAVDFSGSNWLVDNVWIQHVTSSFWCAGFNGLARNCRTLSVWSDGGNFNNVQSANGIGINLTYSNNFVRGTGDDAMAINSVNYNTFGANTYYYTTMSNITYVNNTAIGAWGGKNMGIYGGINDLVTNNLLCDTARYIGLGVGKFGVNGSDLQSATVTGNTVVRCGGNGYLQQQPAMMIGNGGDGQGAGTVANAYCARNTISNALFSALGLTASTNIVFQYNTIISPGMDGIVVGPPSLAAGVIGTAIVNSNIVTALPAGRFAVTNGVSGYTVIVPVMAVSYSAASGVTIGPCTEGGQALTGIAAGSYAAYANVNLNGVNAFVARVASATVGGNIEIHLDSPSGMVLGVCTVPGTGGWQNFADAYCAVTNAAGTHTVCLVFNGAAGSLFDLEFFGLFAAPPVYSHRLLVGNTYALKSPLNGQYVSATNSGDFTLAAQGASVSAPEEFQIYNAGGGNLGLLALANTNYVCADNSGSNPLIANRTGVGSWETFTEFDAGNGNVALRSMANGKYVTVSNSAAATLIAQSVSVGTGESFSVQFIGGVPPAPPGGLAANAANAQVGLLWAVSPGATSYNLMRSATYAGTYSVIASNLPDPSYLDTDLANGTAYYYAVSALNPAGASTNSPPVGAVAGSLARWSWTVAASSTEAGGSPDNAIDGNINTRWSTGVPQTNGMWFQVDLGGISTFRGLVLDAGSSANDFPRGYQVNLSSDGVNWGGPVVFGAGSSAVTTILFGNQVARYIRVMQTGSVAGTWWSIHELNVLGTVPSAPAGLAVSVSGSEINLSWTASASASGYNIGRSVTSGGPYATIARNVTDITFPDTGLTGGTLYYYVVTGTNAFGESARSNEVAVRLVATSPPPLSLAVSRDRILLDWPLDHTGWRLEAQTNSLNTGLGTNWTTIAASATTNSLSLPLTSTNGAVFFRLAYP